MVAKVFGVQILNARMDALPTIWQISGMVAAISCVLIFSRE